jgi:hypothetical protein
MHLLELQENNSKCRQQQLLLHPLLFLNKETSNYGENTRAYKKITVRVNFETSSPRLKLCLRTKATDFLLSHRGGTEVLAHVSRWQKYARATELVEEQSSILNTARDERQLFLCPGTYSSNLR